MDEARAARWFYLYEAAGPMEMAGDVLNLFLIKEKAPACVRDELLECRGGARERLPHTKVGECAHLPNCPALSFRDSDSPSLPAALPTLQRQTQVLPAPAPLGRLVGTSAMEGEGTMWWTRVRQQCSPGQVALPLALSLLISKTDTRGSL